MDDFDLVTEPFDASTVDPERGVSIEPPDGFGPPVKMSATFKDGRFGDTTMTDAHGRSWVAKSVERGVRISLTPVTC